MGKHIAMMSFRGRMRKQLDEDIQVFGYNLEVLLRRAHAVPKIGEGDRGTLLKQQFWQLGSNFGSCYKGEIQLLQRELLQRPFGIC
ncbi:Hypothetical predicted protein [Paramuricea clavata]|uniref:Uncharacterized protein n=1 Tax=Paramuricea clavata TaxID=317549 RepID=A0A7D9JM50_PARCT|nr:Hypothetical predicted protein [Paramuricea clavata]